MFYDLGHDPHLFSLTKQAMEETGIPIHDIDLIAIRDNTEIAAYEAEDVYKRQGPDNLKCRSCLPDDRLRLFLSGGGSARPLLEIVEFAAG